MSRAESQNSFDRFVLGFTVFMPAKTLTEQLEELSARMVKEQDPKTFSALVKQMSQLLAVEGMSRLLAERAEGLRQE